MPESDGNTVRLAINDLPPVEISTRQSLLATLKAQSVFVPSACGGHGVCGLCRVKVLAGAGPYTAREEALLSEADRLAGMRLACQVTVERDLRITIPNDYFTAREYKAEVVALRDLTSDIREITLQLRSPPVIDFKAGQYIQLRIPPYEQSRRTIYRAYSIASPPSAHGRLELEVRQVLNGIGSTYLCKHLAMNAPVVFNGPYGDFYLRESEAPRDKPRGIFAEPCEAGNAIPPCGKPDDLLAKKGNCPIILIAGGSGMAPMKSLLCDMQERKISRPVRYFFGAHARRDLFLMDEMQALQQSLSDFRFIPALSKPLPEDHWTGETGLITEVLCRQLENAYTGEAYLCGSPAMIQASIKILQQKGVTKDRMFYDSFA